MNVKGVADNKVVCECLPNCSGSNEDNNNKRPTTGSILASVVLDTVNRLIYYLMFNAANCNAKKAKKKTRSEKKT